MNEIAEKLDRRRKRTRQLLRKALIDLIVEKGFETLTIQEIVDRADVSRATFYLHFKDKEELLFESMKEVYDDLVLQVNERSIQRPMLKDLSEGNHDAFCEPYDFQHVAEHADFYRVLLGEKGTASFVLKVRGYLAAAVQREISQLGPAGIPPRLPTDLLAHAIAGAEIGVMSWWLSHGERYTSAQMARMFYALSAFGMWWALGLDIKPPADLLGAVQAEAETATTAHDAR
jgi:AcrR family transcriptional regulator